MIDPVIQTSRLCRYFGNRPIVRDLDMQIPAGQVTAMLGLNGAGKTTTIRILMGLLRPTRGTATVLGEDASQMSPATRGRIGYMVEGHFLFPSLTVDQCASLQRAGYASWDDSLFRQILYHFGIHLGSRVSELSRGQRAGVSLALVLAPDPELLVLDDPALGLDPVSRRSLNETLVEFASNGQRTVLLSTHLLDDVERVADRVMVLVGGRLKVDTSMEDFAAGVSGFAVKASSIDPNKLAAIPGLIEARPISDGLHLSVANCTDETRAAIDRLAGGTSEPIELTFGDGVLAYLARERGESSFLNLDRTGAER
ncbi:ABC transporter ATP-binding protein [Rubripirellula reticaptiva]|uniref:Putative ABC transporter ATP-binding protein YbhF n=1 Tax=Rubripirellula reticaptiva TaxID=2528013 RepID=A0A5C6EJV9_9BACT|nr:ABC transporter ATP-binding protein [Rubripirellula reticaptiva]TWU47906.1 putative ABC transporter ATP-binding protein YbhF [Rubripirellula reticaptiva]